MAKTTAWLTTLIGLLLVLGKFVPALNWQTQVWVEWVVYLAVLIIGVTKLARNYKLFK